MLFSRGFFCHLSVSPASEFRTLNSERDSVISLLPPAERARERVLSSTGSFLSSLYSILSPPLRFPTVTPSDYRPSIAFELQGLLPPPPLDSTMKIPPFGLNDDEDGDSVEEAGTRSFSHFPAVNIPVDTLGRCQNPMVEPINHSTPECLVEKKPRGRSFARCSGTPHLKLFPHRPSARLFPLPQFRFCRRFHALHCPHKICVSTASLDSWLF